MANPEGVDEVNPFGAKAREPYQNFDGESQLSESIASRNQLHPPHIGGGLGGGGCFFASFFAPKKVRNYLLMKKRLLSVASLCESEQARAGGDGGLQGIALREKREQIPLK